VENPQLKIYRSSAGSGKTFRLAADYLKLALRHPLYYRKILAVTFTNKATWEMKARIINNLHALSRGKAGTELVDLLQEETGWDQGELQERSEQTLKAILHGYGYFSVSTIDSFFQRVVSSFAKDIEVQGGFTIEFDLDRVTEEILDMLFLDLENDPRLLNWLVRFTESRIEDNKGWDVRNEVRKLARELFYDRFFQNFGDPGENLLEPEKLSGLLDDIFKIKTEFENRLKNYGREGLNMMETFGVSIDDLYYTNTGPGGLLMKLAAGTAFNLNSYVQAAYENRDRWLSGKCRNKDSVLAMLDGGLFDLYREAIDYYNREIIRQNTYSQVLRFFYNLGLLANLLENLKKYRLEHGVILISDLSRLLRIIIGENDAPYIYEKVGNHFQHFLIDEFQDTSTIQWQNFKPLVKNSLAMGNYNMLVGDIKQSIYRWRGGDWQLLHEQVEQDIGQSYITRDNLKTNWRSRENIIHFNNFLFETIPGQIGGYYSENQETSALHEVVQIFSNRFRDVYSDAAQELPDQTGKKDGGFISLQFLSAETENEHKVKWHEMIFDQLINVIHSIQDKGYKLRDIAVLVRTKNEGKRIADFLLGYKNLHPESPYRYDVISSESLFLNSSPAVNVVISFMKLIQDENDSLALINLHYWLAVLGNDPRIHNPSEIFSSVMGNPGPGKIFPGKGFAGSWQSLPLIDMLERIIRELGLEGFPFEEAYLTGLQNVILDYLTRNKNDLFSFLDWWKSDGARQSIKPAEGQNAIQIMTIHQAKGLQFEMVIIPFCSWNIDHMTNSTIIWCQGGDELLANVPFYPIKYGSALLQSGFSTEYLNEQSLAYMDNLNLLYVAFTRAVNGLFVFAEKPSKPGKITTVGDVVFRALDSREEIGFKIRTVEKQSAGEILIYEYGQIPAAGGQEEVANIYITGKYKKGEWRDKISIREQPDLFNPEDDDYHSGEKINYGILLHDLLSRIFLKEQSEEVLKAGIKTGGIRAGQEKKIREMLNKLWKNEQVMEWFSGKWEVRTEVPVLPRSGQLSRMDRVMIREDQAIVVDYKTGRMREEHKSQVLEYRRILRQMGYKKVEGYLLYLGNGKLISV
jgi:ATP-dependent exoDNAse (exonuclease V) beta subunit